jgi:hypothetical protein
MLPPDSPVDRTVVGTLGHACPVWLDTEARARAARASSLGLRAV